MASFTCRNAFELGVSNLGTISMVCLKRQRKRERESVFHNLSDYIVNLKTQFILATLNLSNFA